MNKRSVLLVIGTLAISSLSFNADAQSLGGMLKKGKAAAEKISATKSQSQEAEKASAVVLDNGLSIDNPIADFIEITPVGLYGVSKDDNYGDAYLVLRAEIKVDKENAAFGSSIKNKKMLAADNNGHVYNIDASGAYRYDLVQDMPILIKIDEPGAMFLNVPKSLTVMPVVKFGINIDAYHQDNITLKNVPIFWDEYPE